MNCSLDRLTADVMERLGEQPGSLPAAFAGAPSPCEVFAMRIRGLLPSAGRDLLEEAPAAMLAGAPSVVSVPDMRMMPCGLYAAILPLPEGFARLVSLRMESWTRAVCSCILPDSGEWERQYSREPGIAGCGCRPQAYLADGPSGLTLTAFGSDLPDDRLSHLLFWPTPEPDADGHFCFPSALYPALVTALSRSLTQ